MKPQQAGATERAGLRSSLAALQAHVAGLIQRYTAEAIASLTGYAYLVEAINAL